MENLVSGVRRSRLIKALKESARTNEGKVHVIPTKGKWGVKNEGADRFYRIYTSKSLAMKIAKEKALAKGSNIVIVHDKYGRIATTKIYTGDNTLP